MSEMVPPSIKGKSQLSSQVFCCFTRRRGNKSSNVVLPDRMFGLRPVQQPLTPDQRSDCSSIPEEPGPIDVIFVHGLGGSARGTWTHPDTKQFWPEWLLRREDMKNVRIYTFGYDSAWENLWAARNYLGIQGFAHQLIDCLILHYEENGDVCALSEPPDA